jgi:hypothetical protein
MPINGAAKIKPRDSCVQTSKKSIPSKGVVSVKFLTLLLFFMFTNEKASMGCTRHSS